MEIKINKLFEWFLYSHELGCKYPLITSLRSSPKLKEFLDDLDPNAVRVELFAEGAEGEHPVCTEMNLKGRASGTGTAHVYGVQVPATRPAADYTPRLVPHYEGVAIPLEAAKILWQR